MCIAEQNFPPPLLLCKRFSYKKTQIAHFLSRLDTIKIVSVLCVCVCVCVYACLLKNVKILYLRPACLCIEFDSFL